MNKTLVALPSSDDGTSFAVAKFSKCLVHHFAGSTNKVSVPIQCKLEDNLLKLSPATLTQSESARRDLYVWDQNKQKHTSTANSHHVVLHHSRECPIGNLSEDDRNSLPLDVQERGIDVAVSLLLQSKDTRVLMTRRPSHMRTFPRAWVPPGGHIEINESLIEAAIRELNEETGLLLDETTTFQVLCLWESVYPFILGLGLPSRHHVVVYLLAKSGMTSDQLNQKIKVDPEEVQAYAWMTPESVQYLTNTSGEQPPQDMFMLSSQGKLEHRPLILSNMFHTALWGNGEIFSGSQLALVAWLESLRKPNNAKL